MFAGVTPVRCAPPSAAMSFICRWRGPPPPACQGGGKALRDLHCATSAVPVISSGVMRRYESHSFVEPVKGSREISLKNAALGQLVSHGVSFRHLPSYTPAPLRGPLPLKGAQGVTGLAFVSPVLSPSFRAETRTGMNLVLHGASEREPRNLPAECCLSAVSFA